MLLDDACEWLDLEGTFGVDGSMDADLGVFGVDCESMGVISMGKWMNERRSGGGFWNEEEGGASRFKSSPLAPNTQEVNVYNECNVTRKDEGEQAQSQAGRPHLGWPPPPCELWLRASGRFLLGLSIFGHLGVLVQKRKEKHGGEEERH